MRFPLRRKPGERAVYMGQPSDGCLFFSMLVNPDEYAAIELRGYATLDGVKARLVPEASSKESGFVRFALDEPYRKP